MSTPHKHAEVLRAIADGVQVQYWATWNAAIYEWVDFTEHDMITPLTHYDLQWRIKPASDLICYSNVYEQFSFSSWSSREDADNFVAADRRKGLLKLTFDGETGLLKSAEVVK